MVLHGTTVATNMVIERKGAEVGMITTKGFRDILHMARHKRPHNFSLQYDVPWQSKPLVKRRNRLVVDERLMPPTGEITVPLNLAQVEEAAQTLKKRGIKSVIICFLFSFLNNKHEMQAKEIVRRVIPDAFICCSSDVVNVIREYERFSTAAMNAYIGPTVALYLRNLENRLKEQRRRRQGPHHAVERRHLDDRELVGAAGRPAAVGSLPAASSAVAGRGLPATPRTSSPSTSAAPPPIFR